MLWFIGAIALLYLAQYHLEIPWWDDQKRRVGKWWRHEDTRYWMSLVALLGGWSLIGWFLLSQV